MVCSQSFQEQLNIANDIYLENPDSSYKLLTKIESSLIKEQKDSSKISKVQLSQIKYLILKTKFDEAIINLNRLIVFFQNNKLTNELAYCYSLKSVLAHKLNEKDKIFHFAHKALKIYRKSNNLQGQLQVLTNLSLDYLKYNMYDSAYFSLNLLFSNETKMTNKEKFFMYQNYGMYYYETSEYEHSVYNLKKAIQISENENMADSKATALMLISKPLIAKKDYETALKYLQESIMVSKQNNLIYELNEAYDQLILIYELIEDYKKAYQTKIINDSIKDEIYNLEKINRINQFESELKLTEKEKLITEQELTIKQKQLEQTKTKSKITSLFFVLIVCLLLIIFVSIIFYRARKLNREINAQKAEIELQKVIVEEKNKEITSSITYAKRIQNAILPAQSLLDKLLPNNFIFYLPKDIVAGDFYWIQQINGTILFAVADCTGHGVPGSLVSVVCHNALNRAVGEFKLTEPAKILDAVSEMVIDTFAKSETEVKDGMDIALCCIKQENENWELEYAGANNSLYLIRNKELIEVKADKQPVGKFTKKQPFTNHNIKLEKNDFICLFSDGYADQFGGPKGKKFMYRSFKSLLVENSQLPLTEQKNKLESSFFKWKNTHDQVDDVCVLGIRI